MGVPGRRDRVTAIGIALLAVVGTVLVPSAASASKGTDSPNIIDTHRVIGPVVGPGPTDETLGLIGPKGLVAPTLGPSASIAIGARVAKSKGTKPTIQKQPSSLSVKSGARTSFLASAKGSPTPSVQWRDSSDGKTWTTIKGATKATYTFVASAKKEGYRFEAVFKNAAGSATTHSAKLTVISAPLVTLQPSAESVQSGQTASFSVEAAASPKPTVRWEMSANGGSWTAISGATADVYSFAATLGQSGEEFEAIFKNRIGQTRTHVATLTVSPAPIAPAMETQPVSETTTAGATVSLTAAASGSPAPIVQWLSSVNGSPWAAISGATSTTYSFAASIGENGTQFEAVFTNVAGSVTSSPVSLTVLAAPAISVQPTGQTVASGSGVSFTAAATGIPAPGVQWYQSIDDGTTWQPYTGPGATNPTLSFTASGPQSLFQFEAVFANSAGTATSSPAVLTVTQGALLSQASNWSGYADYDTTTPADTAFTAVTSSWTVPTLTCPGSSTSYSSEWIGIDGYSQNATSVEQDGTEMDCFSGVPQYDAWFEMFGDQAEADGDELELSPSSYPVDPGDVISASVSVVNSHWTLSLADASSGHVGWTFSTEVTFSADELSAEWILERPELCTTTCVLPALADFGNSIFTNAQATSTQGAGPIDVFVNDEIDMVGNTDNVLAAPGALNGLGNGFTDTWSGSS